MHSVSLACFWDIGTLKKSAIFDSEPFTNIHLFLLLLFVIHFLKFLNIVSFLKIFFKINMNCLYCLYFLQKSLIAEPLPAVNTSSCLQRIPRMVF